MLPPSLTARVLRSTSPASAAYASAAVPIIASMGTGNRLDPAALLRSIWFDNESVAALNFPNPKPIPLMKITFQMAQKLHGVSQRGSSRVRDLIDLQLIVNNEVLDLQETASVCRRLFKYRRMQSWPPEIVKAEDWDATYNDQRLNLPVLTTVDEAVAWANDLIAKIDNA